MLGLDTGHTHTDVDQGFSWVYVRLCQVDAVMTLSEYIGCVVDAYSHARESLLGFERIDFSPDYKSWYNPHLNPGFHHYCKAHVFKFERDPQTHDW